MEIDQRKVNKILKNAQKAVSSLEKKDFAEMKVLNAPPEGICVVMGAVCLLYGFPERNWKSAKKLLQGDLLNSILNFDVNTVNQQTIKTLKKEYTKHESNKQYFVLSNIEKKSKACAGLSQWVLAIE